MNLQGVPKSRRKKFGNGVKCRLIAQLCHRDLDFKFEYAVRGLEELMRAYTCKQLKDRLNRLTINPLNRTVYYDTRGGRFYMHDGHSWVAQK